VKFFEFILKESDAPLSMILFMSMVSGIATASLLATINAAAEMVSNSESYTQFFLIYLVLFAIFGYAQNYALTKTTIGIEHAIRNMRMRVANKIRLSELRFIEEVGRSDIYVRLTQDSNLLSESAPILVMASQSLIITVFSMLYIAWLSLMALFFTIIALGTGILTYLSINQKISAELRLAAAREAEFFDMLDHLLSGFKEIKLNHRKSHDLFERIEAISNETEWLKVNVGSQTTITITIAQGSFYLILALIVFIVPQFNPTFTDTILKLTSAVLFIMGPISTLVTTLSVLTRTQVAVTNIYNLEAKLDAAISDISLDHPFEITPQFNQIELEEITFCYKDEHNNDLFSIGPINVTIRRGELLFIVGGNGSGKSTFLKLLVRLYFPTTGRLYWDDEVIDQTNYKNYRELFAIIFGDFHLFDRLYGLSAIDKSHLHSLLRLMALEKKTKYLDGRFTNLELSTGQKKRLAMIAALLEDKPIYIFDEWAADQDPTFRKYFYEVLLQDLKAQGKTIIAVTHDDKYFDTADRVLKMEYGKLTNYEKF
jgi:putative ATP-binding cassette transporter